MALYRKYTDSEYKTMTLTEFVDAINEIVSTNAQSEQLPDGATSFTITESATDITEDDHIEYDSGIINLKRLILTGELEPEHQGLSDKIKGINLDMFEVNTDQVTSFAGVFSNLSLESGFNVTTLGTDGLTTPFSKAHWPISGDRTISDLFMSENVETTYTDETGEHDIFTSDDSYLIIDISNIEVSSYPINKYTTKSDKIYKDVERLEFYIRVPSENYIIPNNVSTRSIYVDIYTDKGVLNQAVSYNIRDIYDSQLNEHTLQSYNIMPQIVFNSVGYLIRTDSPIVIGGNEEVVQFEIDNENYGFGLTVQSDDDNLILCPGKSKKYTASLVDAKGSVTLSSVSTNTPEEELEGLSVNPVEDDPCSASISFNESEENKSFEKTLGFTGTVTIEETSNEISCTEDVKLLYLVIADFGELSKTAIFNGSGINDSTGTITVPSWQQDFGTLTASAVLKKGVPIVPSTPEEDPEGGDDPESTEPIETEQTEPTSDGTDPAQTTEDPATIEDETESLPEGGESENEELPFDDGTTIVEDGATVTFNAETGTFEVVIAKDKLTEADTYTVEVTITNETVPEISIPVKQTLVLEETTVSITGETNKVLKAGESVTYTPTLNGFVDNLEIHGIIIPNKPDCVSFNEDTSTSIVITFNDADVNNIVKKALTFNITVKEKDASVVVSKDLEVSLLSLVNFEATDFGNSVLDETNILENNVSTITVKDYNQTDFANVEFTAEIYLRNEKLDDSAITIEKTENGATVNVIKEKITSVGHYTVKLFVKDASWTEDDIITVTKEFDVTDIDIIDTDPTNNVDGVAEKVKCVLRFNW
jgi:hypothetical protein